MAEQQLKCRTCGYEINTHSQLTDETKQPEAGDISVCLKCATVSIFDDKGNIIEPTEIERMEIENDSEVKKIRKAILQVNLRKNAFPGNREGKA